MLDQLRARLTDREHDDVSSGQSSRTHEVAPPAHDAVAANTQEPQSGVIIDEPDYGVGRVIRGVDKTRHLVPGIARSVDKRGHAGRRRAVASVLLARHAEDPPPGRHEEERQGWHDEGKPPGEQWGSDVKDCAEYHADGDDHSPERGHFVETADLGPSEVEVGRESHHDLQDHGADKVGPGYGPHTLAEQKLVTQEQEAQQRE